MGKTVCTFIDEHGVIRSPGHSQEGRTESDRFLKRIAAPKRIGQFVLPLVQEHMTHMHGEPTGKAIRRLATRLEPASIELWEALVEADASGRAPAPTSRPAEAWLREAEHMQHHQGKPAPIVAGEMLLDIGISPGPEMGNLIRHAYEAQLDGIFTDEAGARAWLQQYVTGK
jgi:tRNA nucleotidyltransferase (CCA-adding enzyme)